MSERFNKTLKASLATHLFIIVLLLGLPTLHRCSKPEKPKEQITFVELVEPGPAMQTAPPAPQPDPEPEPPKPKPPEPEPPPPEPDPIKEPDPKPVKPEVKKPKEIKVNTNRVVRKDLPKPVEPVKTPKLTEKQLREMLSSDLRTTPASSAPIGSRNSGPTSQLGSYYGSIYKILFTAWDRPPGISGLKTTVSIRIAKNGTILQRNQVSGSGSPEMDQSVMNALRAVSSLPRLPDSVMEAFIDVEIDFESSGLSM